MRKILALFLLIFSFLGCSKQENGVPNVPVNFNSPLTDPRLNRLSSAGGAVEIPNHGVSGLIIYRRADNVYVAYDRCSTVNPEKKCAVKLDDPTLTVTDPCSGAKFSLWDGSPVKAPATQSLREYRVTIAGNTLQIMN
ncbi:MAG: hypothetical protein K2Q03_03325 [Sphingobacteriaceae bacterium]|nr:hypothetical protein [Sphingobacteriaceae bacterium]